MFGAGSSDETGEHLAQLGVTRALVVCDPFVSGRASASASRRRSSAAGVESVVYDRIAGEPSETSVAEAVAAARDGFDGFVGIGGGSALDTAKLCALFATHGGELLDYVNAPIGRGAPVPGPSCRSSRCRRPPAPAPRSRRSRSSTSRGSGRRPASRTSTSARRSRSSIPALTVSCPPGVTAATGIDALMHALEAYTVVALRHARAPPARPSGRRTRARTRSPTLFCERAIALVGRDLRTAVADGDDLEARTAMALASTLAGIAFSGAGVHVPHALAYPIASLQHDWKPPGYGGAALVPHGFAVAVTAPAVFRFIADAAPERCATAARLLDGGDDLAARSRA